MKIGKYDISVDKQKVKSFFRGLPEILLYAVVSALLGIGNILAIITFIERETQTYIPAIGFFVLDGLLLLLFVFIIVLKVDKKGDEDHV